MENQKVPTTFYVFGTIAVIALVGVAFIPSSMIFRLRIFDAVGLPEWMAEVVRFIILFANPFAVAATGLIRLFSVSDKSHARALTVAAILEILSFAFEIIAAMVNGNDIIALAAQGLLLVAAVVCVAVALVVATATSGFYKMAVAHSEQAVMFDENYNKLFRQQFDTKEVREAMQAAIVEQIKAKTELQAGRQLWDSERRGLYSFNDSVAKVATPINNGNGAHPNAPTPSA